MVKAVDRIGDLFGSRFELYLWLVMLHGDKFKDRMRAIQSSILVPPSQLDRTVYGRTWDILVIHSCGLDLVSAMGRAALNWDQDRDGFKTDWESSDPLSAQEMEEWVGKIDCVASSVW